MTNEEIFKDILWEERLTQEKIAKMMGYANQGAIGNKMKNGITIRFLSVVCNALGSYHLVIEKRAGKKVVKRWEIEPSEVYKMNGRGKKNGESVEGNKTEEPNG